MECVVLNVVTEECKEVTVIGRSHQARVNSSTRLIRANLDMWMSSIYSLHSRVNSNPCQFNQRDQVIDNNLPGNPTSSLTCVQASSLILQFQQLIEKVFGAPTPMQSVCHPATFVLIDNGDANIRSSWDIFISCPIHFIHAARVVGASNRVFALT